MVLFPVISIDQIRKYGPTQILYTPQLPNTKNPKYKDKERIRRSMMNLEDILVDKDMRTKERKESI